MTNKILTVIGCIFLLGLLFSVVYEIDYGSNAEAKVIRNTQWKHFTGLSSDTKPTLEEREAGSTFIETDTMGNFIWNGSAWTSKGFETGGYLAESTAGLTAPGFTAAINVRGYSKGGYYIETRTVDTSVALALQLRTVGSEWTSVADSTVYTVNKNDLLISANVSLADSARLWWISEAGGTSGTVSYAPSFGGQ